MTKAFGASKLARAAVLMTGSTYVAYAAGLVASTIVARVLGPADYGRYAYVLWLSSVLVILMNNGLTTSSIRFVSEFLGRNQPWAATALVRRFAWWQVFTALVAGGGFLLVLPWLQPTGWTSHLFLFAAVTLLASWGKAAYLFRVSVAKGCGQFGMEALSVTIAALLSLIGVAVLAVTGAGLNEMLYLFVGINLSQWPMLWWLLKRNGLALPPLEEGKVLDADVQRQVRDHLLWTVALTLVAAFSNKSVETFLLNRHAGAEIVGFFAVAAALTRGGVDLLSSGLNSILMPTMAHGFGQGGTQRVGEITAEAVRMFHFLGMLLAGVGLMWAQPVVLLMYGAKYAPAASALEVMVVVGGVTLSNGALGALLSTTGNQRMRTAVLVSSLVISGAIAVALVPTWGLVGALVSHAVSTLVVLALTLVIIQRSLGISLPWSSLVRMSLAAVLSAAGVWVALQSLDNVWARWAGGLVFVPLYLWLTVRLRVWKARDVALVARYESKLPFLRPVLAYMARWAN